MRKKTNITIINTDNTEVEQEDIEISEKEEDKEIKDSLFTKFSGKPTTLVVGVSDDMIVPID